jgi:murein DD-endopeptidase MepM/ murein hydrolase activator NlpD
MKPAKAYLLNIILIFFSFLQLEQSQLCVTLSTPQTCLNMRAAPSLNALVLRCLSNETQVEDLGELINADNIQWREIRIQGMTGWSSDRFLTPCGHISPPHPATIFKSLPFIGDFKVIQFFGDTMIARFFNGTFYDPSQGMHTGIDWEMPHNTLLIAICDGDVVHSGNFSPFGAGPRSVILRCRQHYVMYGHVSSELVVIGQNVTVGQPLAKSFGFSSLPLAHLEVRPIPSQVISVLDPSVHPMNSGICLNPINFFEPSFLPYFEQQLQNLGGLRHFCTGNMTNQPAIRLGGPRRSDPCTNVI